jgi:hypothetical protein
MRLQLSAAAETTPSGHQLLLSDSDNTMLQH